MRGAQWKNRIGLKEHVCLVLGPSCRRQRSTDDPRLQSINQSEPRVAVNSFDLMASLSWWMMSTNERNVSVWPPCLFSLFGLRCRPARPLRSPSSRLSSPKPTEFNLLSLNYNLIPPRVVLPGTEKRFDVLSESRTRMHGAHSAIHPQTELPGSLFSPTFILISLPSASHFTFLSLLLLFQARFYISSPFRSHLQ